MPAAKKSARRRRPQLDRAQLKQREAGIIADLKAGFLSYRKIAAKWKVSLPTVNAKARKAGITRPRGRRPASVLRVAAKAAMPMAGKGRSRATQAAAKPRALKRAAAKTGRRRKSARRPARAPRPATVKRAGFMDSFRELLLNHFPAIAYVKVHRLERLIEKELS